MELFINKRVRVIPDVILKVVRRLPGAGKIAVQVGQEVAPDDILGGASTAAGFRSLNLAKLLEVSPPEAQKYLQRPLGQPIYKGELLAFKKEGLWGGKKIVTAPTDGILDSLNSQSGELKIHIQPKKINLPSALYGLVEQVNKDEGEALIRTQVTVVYGVLGTGKEREGILRLIGKRGDLIGTEQILPEFADQLLVCGGLIYKQALTAALSFGVNGIITGGVNAKDFKSMAGGTITTKKSFGEDVGLSILVCEGFGTVSLGEDIFDMMLKHNNRFAIIDGNRQRVLLPSLSSDSMLKIRKTSLPPGSKTEPLPPLEALAVAVNQKVRVIGSPYMGEQGTIESIDQVPTLFLSDIKTYCVTVVTRSRKIKAPYTNLEIISS